MENCCDQETAECEPCESGYPQSQCCPTWFHTTDDFPKIVSHPQWSGWSSKAGFGFGNNYFCGWYVRECHAQYGCEQTMREKSFACVGRMSPNTQKNCQLSEGPPGG